MKEPARVHHLSEVYKAFDPMFARLAEEVQRSLESFHKETGPHPATCDGAQKREAVQSAVGMWSVK